jgi:hypothetical protein
LALCFFTLNHLSWRAFRLLHRASMLSVVLSQQNQEPNDVRH